MTILVYKCICDSYDITATGCRDKVPVHPGRRFMSTFPLRDVGIRLRSIPGDGLCIGIGPGVCFPLAVEHRDGELA